MRTKLVNLLGKEYWLAHSAQSQMNLEAFRRQPGFSVATHGAQLGFETLCETLRAGYRWAKLTGATPCNEPPAREDLADLLGEDDILAIVPAMNEVVTGERNVEAKPPKKAGAKASDG